ncbi:MAG: hypothetical protein JRF49_01180 [Deltaproteobacteria bacterium]|nr:hypothetical protein [Deltaproteobacteria bacterium]
MKKDIFLNAALFLISIFVTFMVLEIGTRVYIKMQGTKLGINRIEHYARSWPLLQGVEGKKYYYELIPSIRKTLEGFTYQINDYGLRDNKEKFFSDSQSFHILVIGCSMTFGVGVDYENTYSYMLEEKLNDHYRQKGREFKVWNGGVPGYSLEQIIGAFEQKTSLLNPDMLILGFFIDTFVRPSWQFRGGILYDPHYGYWFQKIFVKSNLLSFILFRYKNQKYNPYNYYDAYYGKVYDRWDNAMKQVKILNDLCKKRGIKLLVADLPTLFWAGPLKKEEWVEYPLNLKLETMCKKEGIFYCNPLLSFEGLEARPLWAIPDYDCHYGPKAAQLVADNIFETLLAINPEKK